MIKTFRKRKNPISFPASNLRNDYNNFKKYSVQRGVSLFLLLGSPMELRPPLAQAYLLICLNNVCHDMIVLT